jgi:hypothetical protein
LLREQPCSTPFENCIVLTFQEHLEFKPIPSCPVPAAVVISTQSSTVAKSHQFLLQLNALLWNCSKNTNNQEKFSVKNFYSYGDFLILYNSSSNAFATSSVSTFLAKNFELFTIPGTSDTVN